MKKHLLYSVAFLSFSVFFAISAYEFRQDDVACTLFVFLTACSAAASFLGFVCYVDSK